MAFPKKHLYNDEKIVLDRHPHWVYLATRTIALVVACALGLTALVVEIESDGVRTGLRYVTALLVVVALIAFVIRLVSWRSTNFTITTERCIYRSGVLKKSGIEIPLDRINTVFFSQTFVERMFRSGDLAIESAGENSRQNFSNITNPVMVQNTIYQQMEENENRKYARIGDEARNAAANVTAQQTQVMSVAEQLEKLADLHQRGVITTEQFEAQKSQLLS